MITQVNGITTSTETIINVILDIQLITLQILAIVL